MNKYNKCLCQLIQLDIKYSKETFDDFDFDSYRFHKIACKEALRDRHDNSIEGIKRYIKELKDLFENSDK